MLLPRGNFTLVYRSLTEFMVAFNNTNDFLKHSLRTRRMSLNFIIVCLVINTFICFVFYCTCRQTLSNILGESNEEVVTKKDRAS